MNVTPVHSYHIIVSDNTWPENVLWLVRTEEKNICMNIHCLLRYNCVITFSGKRLLHLQWGKLSLKVHYI